MKIARVEGVLVSAELADDILAQYAYRRCGGAMMRKG
jgi:hypothetical protein